jgi:hypothetical protein
MERGLEQEIWRRAKDRCEYCHFPANLTLTPFQIDHIIAEKHAGKTESLNLALACYYCNNYKGPNIAGFDQTIQQIVRLFNPRVDVWSDHFHWQGAVLTGKTPIARVTLHVLNINRPDSMLLRECLIHEGVWFE